MLLTASEIEQYHRDGYHIARGLFSKEEAARYIDHYMDMRAQGSFPGDFGGIPIKRIGKDGTKTEEFDSSQKYPRLIHMHRWDQISLDWMIDKRINEILTALLGMEPYAVQTMLYFKPAGARGQALHQDQYYLKVQPGTCMAAWMALEDCDVENGCLQIVKGSHNWPLLCPIGADSTASWSDITVPLPEGVEPTPMIMKAGDVLFFNGSVVHGSFSNSSKARFRRSLIGHYIAGDSQQAAQYYHPVLRMDGSQVEINKSPGGGACGVWVDSDDKRIIEMSGELGKPIVEHE
jgi:ectoine hydroxylase-related dioxygenase (phytanoyl-CoA dioxygenase family)